MKLLLTVVIVGFSALPSFAKHLYTETEYQQAWCNAQGGIIEYRLPDYTRVDCMANIAGIDYAIEFDFSRGTKVYECIGQALYYGLVTGRKPGAVLIIEEEKDYVYLERFQKVANFYGITFWIMTSPNDTEI